MKVHKGNYMHIRENTYDAQIIKEIAPTYGWMNVKNKVVLDIGGCFGASAVFFAEQGAAKVISIEPEPANFKLLSKNIKGLNVLPVNAACVEDKNLNEIKLYLNSGINKGIHSTVVKRGRGDGITVKTVQFSELLKQYKPSVIKLDVEGAEYFILTKPLPKCVKEVTVEIHFGKKINREVYAPQLISLFKDWVCVKSPKLEGNNWTTIGAWKRK